MRCCKKFAVNADSNRTICIMLVPQGRGSFQFGRLDIGNKPALPESPSTTVHELPSGIATPNREHAKESCAQGPHAREFRATCSRVRVCGSRRGCLGSRMPRPITSLPNNCFMGSGARAASDCPGACQLEPENTYCEIIPTVPSHFSTSRGHPDTGSFDGLRPNA